jgi:hypothetical protein
MVTLLSHNLRAATRAIAQEPELAGVGAQKLGSLAFAIPPRKSVSDF